MKKFFTLLAFLGVLLSSFAQQTGKVSGHIQDGSPRILESATISLLRAADSSIAKVAAADKAGRFVFDGIGQGAYLVRVTLVGHKTAFSPIFQLTSGEPSIELKSITLQSVEKSMTGITVTARKPLIEQRIDRTIVNVDASPTNVGSTALEVLEKSPGISVDKDGNISLKGKQGVMVFVDGRPTQLGAADLANMLRNMTASQLDQIEIMTNPPAKYDAAGNAGIINIKTKKNKQVGYNGSLSLGYGQGRYPKFNESLNMNYRQNKVNLFANLSHNYRKGFQDLDIQRRFRDRTSKELISTFDQQARMMNESNSYNGKIGFDYFANKTTTYGVVLTGSTNPRTFENRNLNNIFGQQGNLTGQTRAMSQQKDTWDNFSTNFNFRKLLDTAGRELTADLDYIYYNGGSNQQLVNDYFNAGGNRAQKSDTLYGNLPQDIRIYSGKVDYVQPLKGGARFEAGVKSSFVRTLNNAAYDTVHYGAVIRDLGRSNDFTYEENINAAYVNLSGSLSKKWSGQIGLRLENTLASGRSKGFVFDAAQNTFVPFDSTFRRSYTQLFPTAFVQFKASEHHTLGMNYGRRIRRPNYESLNPFIEYLDRYTYMQGNPNLLPQFSHNIELSHTFRGILTTTLNYTQTNDIIQQVFEQNELRNETFVKQANIAKQRQYGIAVSLGMPLTSWWTTNIYVNAFNNRFEGLVDGTPVTVSASTVALNGSQQFKLSKTLSAELSGWYRTAAVESILSTRPMGMMSIGFSQQVLKGKGTLRLNVRDIFYTQRFSASTKYGSVDAAFQEQSDSRVVNIGFTYRFSKGKINGGSRKRAGSANDEQSRVGGGN
jgi:iron complex outermembrane receptor protein